MKMPDVMLDLTPETLEIIEKYKAREMTEDSLRAILRETRQEHGGLSIEEVAHAIRTQFDTEELKALVTSLQTFITITQHEE